MVQRRTGKKPACIAPFSKENCNAKKRKSLVIFGLCFRKKFKLLQKVRNFSKKPQAKTKNLHFFKSKNPKNRSKPWKNPIIRSLFRQARKRCRCSLVFLKENQATASKLDFYKIQTPDLVPKMTIFPVLKIFKIFQKLEKFLQASMVLKNHTKKVQKMSKNQGRSGSKNTAFYPPTPPK